MSIRISPDWQSIVAPLVGAWIEIALLINVDIPMRSLPSWERGLKYAYLSVAFIVIQSLPSWERGLKSPFKSLRNSKRGVAPLVGAWIEMVIR